MSFISTNPATGNIISRFKEHTKKETELKLAAAKRAGNAWRTVPLLTRTRCAMKLALLLRKQKHELGLLATLEMGKPIRASIAEVEKCAWATEYFAENAERFLSPDYVKTDASESFVSFEPLGIILGIMPWNFPFWQVLRYAVPALLSGNAALLKHASTVSGCALRTEALFREAGFPKGLFQVLLIEIATIPAVIADHRISAVTLTGSERAGSIVASLAGKAIKKSILELGGSDPFIVLADADIETAAHTGARARLQNAGQSCIAAKRFIVARQKEKQFTELLATRFKEMVVGDGMDETTDIGPLASEKMLEGLQRQVTESVALGAKIVCGGKRIDRAGYFYEPTILTNVKQGMPVVDEEVFGPVAAVIAVRDEEEAIKVANDTPYGLGASLWTKNIAKAKRIIPRIESGSVFVNDMVKSDPRLPFGGVKKSGYGRELSGFGLREFTNIKTVYIK